MNVPDIPSTDYYVIPIVAISQVSSLLDCSTEGPHREVDELVRIKGRIFCVTVHSWELKASELEISDFDFYSQ